MGIPITTKIDIFNGGIASDPKDQRLNVARFISNGDVFTNPKRILPYRQTESGDENATTLRKQNFAIARRTLTAGVPIYSVCGLGVASGTNRGTVQTLDLDSSLNTDVWTAGAGSGDADYAAKFDCFVYYQNQDLIFGWAHFATGGTFAGVRIFSYNPTTAAWTDNAGGGLATQGNINTIVAQGLVHSKDDRCYMAADNLVFSKNGSGAFALALTLPVNIRIASMCEYGDFIAILASDRNGVSNSRVFIWDRNETTTTLSESLDAGTGTGLIIEIVDGELIVISQKGGEAQAFAGGSSSDGTSIFSEMPQSSITARDKVIFRQLAGNRFVKIFELRSDRTGGSGSTSVFRHKQLVDNRLFFQMIIRYNGSVRDGLWSFGRSGPGEPFTLVREQPSNNNTALTTGDIMRGFLVVGDFIFQSFGSGGSGATYNTRKTVEITDTSYSANTIIETITYDGSRHGFNESFYKDLSEVSIMTDSMVTAGVVQVDYAINIDADDGIGSWTTIFTNSTNSSISHTANNIESSGAALPKQYKNIAFRIIATGGAIVTGFEFKEDVVGKRYVTD